MKAMGAGPAHQASVTVGRLLGVRVKYTVVRVKVHGHKE